MLIDQGADLEAKDKVSSRATSDDVCVERVPPFSALTMPHDMLICLNVKGYASDDVGINARCTPSLVRTYYMPTVCSVRPSKY
jgi:hypothetical protein